MSVSLEHFLAVSSLLFAIGLFVALSKRNAVAVLMGVELMLNASNLALVAFARLAETALPVAGHVFVVFVITVAAAEVAVALALAVSVYRARGTIDVDAVTLLRL